MRKLLLISVALLQIVFCLGQAKLSVEASSGVVFKNLNRNISSARFQDFEYKKLQGYNLSLNLTVSHKAYFEHGLSLMYTNEAHDKEYQNIEYEFDRNSNYVIEWWLPDTLLTMTNWKKYSILYGVGVKKKWGNFSLGTRLYLGGTYTVAPKRTEIFNDETIVQTAKGFYFSGRVEGNIAYQIKPFLSVRMTGAFMATNTKELRYQYTYASEISWHQSYLLNIGMAYHFVRK